VKRPRPKAPPAYPPPVTDPNRRRATQQAVGEFRELRRSIARGRFSLYSTLGRFYLGGLLVAFAAIAVTLARAYWGKPLRSQDVIYAIVGAVGFISIPLALILTYLKERRIHRLAAGLCSKCGYDLRASQESGGALLYRCPECGTRAGD
jgi:hypothetical protein